MQVVHLQRNEIFSVKIIKIFLKIFAQVKKSLYICTRNSAP